MGDLNQYLKLQHLVLTEYNLKLYDYPYPRASAPGKAEVANMQKMYSPIINPSERLCRRCNKTYIVQQNGQPVKTEECRYHPFRTPNPGKPYRCCFGSQAAKPCKIAKQHVTEDIDLNNLTGFLCTSSNRAVDTKAAYAMDCEMVYTDSGQEVAALSVVDMKCDVVYETKIVPDHRIVDYNTEFSGLREQDFQGVTTTLKDVHEKFRTLFGPNTILVGHGLSHDLLRLRVIHNRVVDTLAAYPHIKGLPFLNSLQYLKDKYLPSLVKSTTLKCRGDAMAAMKLALLK